MYQLLLLLFFFFFSVPTSVAQLPGSYVSSCPEFDFPVFIVLLKATLIYYSFCFSFFKFNFIFNWRIITMLWWFLPHTNTSQPQVYTCPLPLEPPSHPLPSLSVSLSTGFGFPASYSKCPLATYFTYGDARFSATLANGPTLSCPRCAHKPVLYVRVSSAALQIGSSAPSF